MKNKREHQQPKPTREQLKIAMSKIADYQKEQREAEENSEKHSSTGKAKK